MKKSILLLAFSATVALADEIPADYIEGEKSAVLVTPEIQAAAAAMLGPEAAAQLLHAAKLQMSKYDRDMQTQSGRRAWHGKLLHSEVYTNELCAVEVYSNEVDGAVWRYRLPFKPKETVSSYNARLPRPPMTNGIPARLAAARQRRYAEQTTVSNVTVNIEANLPPTPEETPSTDESDQSLDDDDEPPPAPDEEPWPNNVEEGSGTASNLVEFVDGINFSENNEYNAEL